jgi:hypothetical protein
VANEDDQVASETTGSSRTRLHGPEAAKAHLTLAVGLALCVVAFWFELHRALGGNSLSWAYVFEWPLLGVFAIYMWWKVINPESTSSTSVSKKNAIAPEFEGMLANWEEHRRQLLDAQDDASKRSDD